MNCDAILPPQSIFVHARAIFCTVPWFDFDVHKKFPFGDKRPLSSFMTQFHVQSINIFRLIHFPPSYPTLLCILKLLLLLASRKCSTLSNFPSKSKSPRIHQVEYWLGSFAIHFHHEHTRSAFHSLPYSASAIANEIFLFYVHKHDRNNSPL